jgi:hypothetical protein
MRKALIILALSGLAALAPSQGGRSAIDSYGFSEGLSPYVSAAKELWGYMDKAGKTVISPSFLEARPFKDGLALVDSILPSGESRQAFIDKKGDVVIDMTEKGYESQYDRFSNGFLPVTPSGGGRPFYIDTRGKPALSPPYDSLSGFSEGLAVFGDSRGDKTLYGYIDVKGAIAIQARYSSAEPFSEGLAYVYEDGADEGQYIDAKGKVAFRTPYSGGPFSEGLAPCSTYDEKSGRTVPFYIDRAGKRVLTLDSADYAGGFADYAGGFSSALAPVGQEWTYRGFMDKSGKKAVKGAFIAVRPFSEGLAAVETADGIGFIDPSGKFVLAPDFAAFHPAFWPEGGYDLGDYAFNEGLSPALKGGWGFIDPKGAFVVEPRYYGVRAFSGGLAYVGVDESADEEWKVSGRFIDKAGKVILAPDSGVYAVIGNFQDGLALAYLDDERGIFIDRGGRAAPLPAFSDARAFQEGLAAFQAIAPDGSPGLWGYMDPKGKIVIKPAYLEATSFSDGVAMVKSADAPETNAYIDKAGKLLFKRDEYLSFSEGLASVEEYGEEDVSFAFIDKAGKETLRVSGYRMVGEFHDGRALVIKGEPSGGERGSARYGFIDKTGKEVIAAVYKGAAQFSGGFAAVLSGRKVGFIDVKGTMAIKPRFSAVERVLGKGGEPGW